MIDRYGLNLDALSGSELEKLLAQQRIDPRDRQQASSNVQPPKAPTLADVLEELVALAASNTGRAEDIRGRITGECEALTSGAEKGTLPVEAAVAAILAEARRTNAILEAVLERLG